MARRVFFSFHYQDVVDFRANVVRNHKLTKDDNAGYFDASIWEEAKKTSKLALKKLINGALVNTSVTCVLIGSETYQRPWVRYEIFRSIYKGNALIGIHINGITGKDKRTKTNGPNPFDHVAVKFSDDGKKYAFTENKDGNWHFWEEIDSTRWFDNDYFDLKHAGKHLKLSYFFKTYDWTTEDGYENFGDWVG